MKKTTIRIFSALLALLLMCSVPFAAGAADAVLVLDTPVVLEYAENERHKDVFTFTPDDSGTYVFYSTGDVDVFSYLNNAQQEELAYSDDELGFPNFRMEIVLEAGQTYTFVVDNYESDAGTSTVVLKKTVAPTSIVLGVGEAYAGYVGTYTQLDAMLMPEYAISEDITYTTTAQDIVSIDEQGNMQLKRVGEATVTAAAESGVTASCVVTVLPAETITVGNSETVLVDKAKNGVTYKFTATEDARLALYTQALAYTHISLYDEEFNGFHPDLYTHYDNNAKIILDVTQGTSYYFVLFCEEWAESNTEFTLHLEKTVQPTALTLAGGDDYYGYPGDGFGFFARFEPINAEEPQVTITSSNPAVAEVEGDTMVMIKEGTATITAQAGTLKSTCKAVVYAPEVLAENTYKTVSPKEPLGHQVFSFKPSKSGNYVFGSTGSNTAVYCNLYSAATGETPEEVYYEETYDSFTACYKLTKGNTYYLSVNIYFGETEFVPFRVYAYRAGTANCADGEHKWNQGAITKMPTTKATGIKTTTCTVCGLTKTASVKKLTSADNTSKVFKDIKKGDWFYTSGAIDFVYNAGLFKGTSETTFAPQTNMTRGMFVTVLGRLAGVSVKKTDSKFTDVPKAQYYSGYVKWASDNGIVNGVSKTSFAPDANVTREQICKMVVEYCNYAGIDLRQINKPVTFKDAGKISGWAKEYVSLCQSAGLINGKGGNVFDPQGQATRAEVATIVNNFSKNYL